MNNNDSPPSPLINKRRRFNRNFRVFVIYKNNTELTREFLINQLKIKTESIVDIIGIKNFNTAVVYCKNAKIMEILMKKNIPDFTFILQSKFSSFKYKIIDPLSKNNIYKIIKDIEEKGYKLLIFNVVTDTGF